MPKKIIEPMYFEEETKSVEDKKFIAFYYTYSDSVDNSDEEGFIKEFEIYTGRTECYENVKNMVINGGISVTLSKIMPEKKFRSLETQLEEYGMMNFDKCMSVYEYCQIMIKTFNDKDFNIDAYYDGDEDEETDEVSVEPQLPSIQAFTAEDREYLQMLEDKREPMFLLKDLPSQDI